MSDNLQFERMGSEGATRKARVPMVLPLRPGAPRAPDLDKYVEELQAATTIRSQVTKDYYCQQLKRLTEVLGQSVEWILSNSLSATEDLLSAKRRDGKSMTAPGAWDTLRSLVQAVLAVLKHVPGASERWPDAHKLWTQLIEDKIAPLVDKKEMSNKLTERQAKGYVPWAEVVKKREEVVRKDPTSVDALLLGMYTMTPGVARADYGDVRVYRPPQDPVAAEGSAERQLYPNYVEWTGSESAGGGSATLHLVAFKTDKSIGPVVTPLSAELTQLIAGSMRKQPRKWLFVQQTDVTKPYSAKAFSKMACARLKALFGVPLTLQVLRHSGSTALDHGNMTEGERKRVAEQGFQHSARMSLIYRVVNGMDRGDKATVCATVCPGSAASSGPAAQPQSAERAKALAESAKRAAKLRESAKRSASALEVLKKSKTGPKPAKGPKKTVVAAGKGKKA